MCAKKRPVSCPHIIKEYNKKMGGVDKADMLISLYRVALKSKKWYMNIFSHLIDISLNNAWLAYKREMQEMGDNSIPLKMFRIQIADALIKSDTRIKIVIDSEISAEITKPIVPRPPPEMRPNMSSRIPRSDPRLPILSSDDLESILEWQDSEDSLDFSDDDDVADPSYVLEVNEQNLRQESDEEPEVPYLGDQDDNILITNSEANTSASTQPCKTSAAAPLPITSSEIGTTPRSTCS
ncbi:unnamed protein product [Parnassius apollo]|uniref:(apollo) hypothetical protein n=1 Tax=Parnassius apollo TaxID=110799 RepID=A0A8S3WBZ5_PARAO|nr:unnamed protein product [Parnassius apollo]